MAQPAKSGFPELDQVLAEMRFPCAVCGKCFLDHSMGALKECFRKLGDVKRDLAVKVLATIEAEERSRFGEGATGISSAVRGLWIAEGIDCAPLTARQEKEGESD